MFKGKAQGFIKLPTISIEIVHVKKNLIDTFQNKVFLLKLNGLNAKLGIRSEIFYTI